MSIDKIMIDINLDNTLMLTKKSLT